jgi:23S rRNA (uridine2552-2'-O)-methyltransferase
VAYNRDDRKDKFFHKAKAEGFLARSAFKLDEIQKKFKILKSGQLVLDLGAAPGAWSQIAVKVVGPQGLVVGLDLKAVEFKAPNARFYQMNAFEFDPSILEGRAVDVLLSDMMANTTGHSSVDQARSYDLCDQVLNLAKSHLRTGGHCVLKIFEGPDARKIDDRFKSMFQDVRRFKPESVRKGSAEIYVVGMGKR